MQPVCKGCDMPMRGNECGNPYCCAPDFLPDPDLKGDDALTLLRVAARALDSGYRSTEMIQARDRIRIFLEKLENSS